MSKYVIEKPGKTGRIFSVRTEYQPLALCSARSKKDARQKFIIAHPDFQSPESLIITPIKSWGFTGDFIEPDAENEPICSLCIEEDGGFMGGEVELPEHKTGPCWHCREMLEQNIAEFIE